MKAFQSLLRLGFTLYTIWLVSQSFFNSNLALKFNDVIIKILQNLIFCFEDHFKIIQPCSSFKIFIHSLKRDCQNLSDLHE